MLPLPSPALLRPGDKRMAALKTGEDVRALFMELFPAFLPAVREVRAAACNIAQPALVALQQLSKCRQCVKENCVCIGLCAGYVP